MDQMDQAMLGMPSREYYLTETDSEYKAAYLRYMINVAELFNADRDAADRDMHDVLRFEEQLANVSFTALHTFVTIDNGPLKWLVSA